MEKLLKPARLDLDPSSSTFSNFIQECGENAPDKLRTLVNCVSHNVYEYIEECTNYDSAISVLQNLYVKTPNEIFARHLLATRQQKPGESLDKFLRELHLAQRNANSYGPVTPQFVHSAAVMTPDRTQTWDETVKNKPMSKDCVMTAEDPVLAATLSMKNRCYFCGGLRHKRITCPARNATCNKCGKQGHFARVCMSKVPTPSGKTPTATMFDSSQPSVLATISGTTFPQSLHLAATSTTINGRKLSALVDSCSDDSYIDEEIARDLKLLIHQTGKDVTLAQKSLHTNSHGYVVVDLTLHLNGQTYPSTRLALMKDLCCGVLLGQDFQKQHQSIVIEYGGPKPTLKLPDNDSYCSLAAAAVDEPSLFQHLSPNCKPIVTKSRCYSKDDREFIEMEINSLLAEGIIESSLSPWRAQVVVVKDPMNRHKQRMCVDYSQTVNSYTELDTYPLPRIDTMVNELSAYHVFSTFDLKSAYHQIPLKESDKKYTAFEANGHLYQFCRVPFGVTNGVAVFQRTMDKLVKEENLQCTFPYLDNITIAGRTQEEHDRNVQHFLEVIHNRNLTLNTSKTIKSVRSINILGYCVGNGIIKPDPGRL
ncbi:uncharacterized protein LOC143020786 [Oratosquilla oratoria]|uniref:uncharacterized protein LOC143020786 n=1 Tax=Oratosquilla oratoria TaxID=337810 RepID=UPI003F76B10A